MIVASVKNGPNGKIISISGGGTDVAELIIEAGSIMAGLAQNIANEEFSEHEILGIVHETANAIIDGKMMDGIKIEMAT